GFMVVYIIGIAKLTDMAFSVNGEIILMSKYYRFSTYSIVVLAILTIILNYLLIPHFGINGAAYASLISIVLFNLLKMGFLKLKFNLIPFSFKNLLLIAITVSVWYLNQLIPKQELVIVDILIRSTFVTVLYCGLVVLLRISEDINRYLNNFIKKYNKKNQ
ncbi:MAG: polysaccharide biosynthesis C-terminal domain-containing protein, partial [Bacteroidota bacterium]